MEISRKKQGLCEYRVSITKLNLKEVGGVLIFIGEIRQFYNIIKINIEF